MSDLEKAKLKSRLAHAYDINRKQGAEIRRLREATRIGITTFLGFVNRSIIDYALLQALTESFGIDCHKIWEELNK